MLVTPEADGNPGKGESTERGTPGSTRAPGRAQRDGTKLSRPRSPPDAGGALPGVTFHDLCETYPAFDVDVRRDQALRVRDLWRWKDVGTFADDCTASVGRHGVVLLRMGPATR